MTYRDSDEYKAWHKTHTWGAYEWFPERSVKQKQALVVLREKNMAKAQTLFEEVEWFLQMGESPLIIAQDFRFNPRSFAKWCRKHDHVDTARLFETADSTNLEDAA